MTKEDLYAVIPNVEEVDKVLVSRLWKVFTAVQKFEAELDDQSTVLEELNSTDNMITKANPFWASYSTTLKSFNSTLAELGLTPKARKILSAKMSGEVGLPKLGN
jgi:phage terminase small subunit